MPSQTSAIARAPRGRALAMLLAVLTLCGVLTGVYPPQQAEALSGSEFDPELIISDDLFYDSSAMTAAQIQAFLDDRVGTCQTSRCLNIAVVPVNNQPATFSPRTGNLECAAIAGGSLRVSELIYRTQVACGISARVILVTLQKEQGLITSRAPSDWALRAAMGMGCPDTAPCSDAFAGLATQIIAGTRQLKVYKAGKFARQPGLNYIGYNPNSSCGGTTLNIRNYATAALYNYTPYQPNAAALANLGTVGDSCSSYGNRNFWWYWNIWFGPTTAAICVANPTREINRYWNEEGGASSPVGAAVSPGIVIGPAGSTIGYYANGAIYCIPGRGAMAVLGDIRVKYDAMGGPASALGAPTQPRTDFAAGGVSGYLQEFQRGTMLSSTTTGTYGVLYGAMRDAWGARGGSGGTLGWPISDQESVAGGVRQQFQRGVLAIPTGKSAIALSSEIAAYWVAGLHTSTLGSPTGPASALTAGGVTGTLQYFDRGMVLSSTATGTFAVLDGPMRSAWGAQGGSGGSYGWPTGDQVSLSGGYRQDFQRGQIFASGSGTGGAVTGDIFAYWNSGSMATRLGYPTSAATAWTAGGVTGTLQYFEKGLVLSSATTGTHAVFDGPMRDAWGARGGSGGSLGWPTGEQGATDGLSQQFQGGVLTLKTGLSGAIAEYWSTGSNGSKLGSATAGPVSLTAGGVTGNYQLFQRGMVLSSTTTGTYAVLDGPIRNAWGTQGGTSGSMGWPTGDQTAISGGVQQGFQRGVIVAPSGGTPVVVSGAIGVYWTTGSNASKLGSPTGAPTDITAGGVNGTYQTFQRGMVLAWPTGTFAVLDGAIRNAWGTQGGTSGSMGWPTGDQQTVGGGVQQRFQRGVVIVPASGSAVVVAGAIGAYWTTGSNGSRLGSPLGSPISLTANGISGSYQVFQRGIVLSSTTTGTYAVFDGPIRNAWGARGGSGGSLGWPIADQTSASGGTQQPFQTATITVTPDGAAIVLSGAYGAYWSTGTNAEIFGIPVAPPVTWSAGGVSGSYQVYERGMVLSSATTGTFGVRDGAIRDVWGAQGGSGGRLGWPIGDQAPSPEGVRQPFQYGAVIVPTSGPAYYVIN